MPADDRATPASDAVAAAMADLRVTYEGDVLLEDGLAADPLSQFRAWYADAVGAGIAQPNAMTVATASADGEPSARTLLLKDVGPRGFVFYTNGVSRKGRDLADNPRAALVFAWLALHRQVVVIGDAEPIPHGETHAYAVSRPWGHRIGALASVQSSVIPSRDALDARVADLEAQYPEGSDVPVPPTWGGYVVHPQSVEFWQGRPCRLHDRLRFRRAHSDRAAGLDDPGGWIVERLSP